MEEADADLDADLQDAQELEDIAACAQIGMQLRQRVILHVDCDEFFLQVHGLVDPTLRQLIASKPCALWQYNDVISMNAAAKAAGVTKHMFPGQARAKLQPVDGHLIHAYWRKWPGPRVNYKPYHTFTRKVFHAISEFIAGLPCAAQMVMEKASSDEGYLDASLCCGSMHQAHTLAKQLQDYLLSAVGMRVSVGCARNKLMAKLASTAAKQPSRVKCGGRRVVVVGGLGEAGLPEGGLLETGQLLQEMNVLKLPGLGSKTAELTELGVRTISELQQFSSRQLQTTLQLSADAAARVWLNCRGDCDATVSAAEPPKSLVVSSWTTHTHLKDIAVKRHTGRGGAAVTIGNGWVFETHSGESKSNATRARWILLAMMIDMTDKIHTVRTEWSRSPQKITVGWHGCGIHPTPGPGLPYLNHESRSKTVALPVEVRLAFDSCTWIAEEVRLATNPGQQIEGIDVSPNCTLTDDGPAALRDPSFERCVASLVDTVASVIQGMVAEEAAQGVNRRIGQLSVSVSDFHEVIQQQRGIQSWLHTTHANKQNSVPCSRGGGTEGDSTKAELLSAMDPIIGGGARDVTSSQNKLEPAAVVGTADLLPNNKSSSFQTAPPSAMGGIDQAVWDVLPQDIQTELATDCLLQKRQQQQTNDRNAFNKCSPKRKRKRQVATKSSPPISSFFKQNPL